MEFATSEQFYFICTNLKIQNPHNIEIMSMVLTLVCIQVFPYKEWLSPVRTKKNLYYRKGIEYGRKEALGALFPDFMQILQ